ncbi:anti-sigma-D factor RsdA [Rhodococcus sp. 1168]|uniref:anti-sigma-D factor RsdA n=1 Tax=Rhodococcus sp. 1168 TaxID=2018041 RepID=UPI000A0CE11A|nr:anti-sigma-D factor RsdA [Rhodococcus sp. 1168]ORI23224.1 hypothetical protein BJI47_09035 [Rhodococcus sp. 1168]
MARNNGRDGIPRIGRPDGSSSPSSADAPYTDAGPVDIAAVRRDDQFIESLRNDGPVSTDNADEYRLALLLAGWRAEVISPALPSGPSVDDVVVAVEQEIAAADLSRRNSRRGRSTFLRPIAGAAAAIAVVMGGLVVFSYNSAPGDPLWSVKSVVFAQQANSTVAQIDTTSKLEQAEQLIAAGDVEGARTLLDGATSTTDSVIDRGQRTDLEMWLQRLMDQLQALMPTLPVLPPFVPPATDSIVPLPENVPSDIPPMQAPPHELPLPPVLTSPVEVPPPPPPVSTPTGLPPTSVPPVTVTAPSSPTVVKEPSPTTAAASGSNGGEGTSQQRDGTLDGS